MTSHLKPASRLTALNCTMYTGFSSLVAPAVAGVQLPLASNTVRLRGSLQSQPITEGRRVRVVRGKAEVGMAGPRMAKL